MRYKRIRAKIIELLSKNPQGLTLPDMRRLLDEEWPAWKRQQISGYKMGGVLHTMKEAVWDGHRIEKVGLHGNGEYQIWFLNPYYRTEAI